MFHKIAKRRSPVFWLRFGRLDNVVGLKRPVLYSDLKTLPETPTSPLAPAGGRTRPDEPTLVRRPLAEGPTRPSPLSSSPKGKRQQGTERDPSGGPVPMLVENWIV